MFLFDRYIARQVLLSAIFAVVLLSVLLVLGNIFKQLLGLPTEILRQMPVSMLLQFIGYAWLSSLPFTVPWALLTSVLLVMGRLSADNELLAMRMSGRSLLRIAAPILIIGLVCTGLCLYINTKIAPTAAREIKQLPTRIATLDPKLALRPGQVTALGDMLLYIGSRKGDRLNNFHSIMLNDKGQPQLTTMARQVKLLEEDKEQRILPLEMSHATYFARSTENPLNIAAIQGPYTTGMTPQTVSVGQLFAKLDRVKPSMMNNEDLRQAIDKIGQLPADEQNKKEKGKDITPIQEASNLRTELFQRFSFSMACIVFVLVAIPLGVTAQRRETAAGFGLSVVLGLAYFSLLILGNSVFRSNPNAMPWLLVWLPNVIFLSLGGWLFWRLQRR